MMVAADRGGGNLIREVAGKKEAHDLGRGPLFFVVTVESARGRSHPKLKVRSGKVTTPSQLLAPKPPTSAALRRKAPVPKWTVLLPLPTDTVRAALPAWMTLRFSVLLPLAALKVMELPPKKPVPPVPRLTVL